MKNHKLKFLNINYFIKTGGYSLIAFPICDTILNRIDLNKIFIFDMNSLLLSFFLAIILGIISATIHNIYNYSKDSKEVEALYNNLTNEFKDLQKKYDSLDSDNKININKYNNLFKDYEISLKFKEEVVNFIKLSIMDKTLEEKNFLKQLLSVINIEDKNHKGDDDNNE